MPYNVACSGQQTVIQLDATGSFDPQGAPLSFSWTTDCATGAIQPTNSATATLTLGNPGSGVPLSCNVNLVVDNGVLSTGCSQKVNMTVCTADCRGQVNGTAVVDQCGQCDGDGKSCLDCRGTPNGSAKVDRCGVCEGDGQSCLDCFDTDITDNLVILDGNLDKIKKATEQLGKRLLAVSKKSRANRNYVTRLNLRSAELYSQGWHLVWTDLPRVIKSCSNSVLCVKVDNQSILDRFNQTSAALLDLANEVARKVGSTSRGKLKPRDKKLLGLAINQHADNIKQSALIPRFVSKCD